MIIIRKNINVVHPLHTAQIRRVADVQLGYLELEAPVDHMKARLQDIFVDILYKFPRIIHKDINVVYPLHTAQIRHVADVQLGYLQLEIPPNHMRNRTQDMLWI